MSTHWHDGDLEWCPCDEKCHCGRAVAAWTSPGAFANANMVNHFCADCITVRCDAYPGQCDRGQERQSRETE